MTLTEFLLARLDEDERVARSMPFEPTWGAYPDEIGQPIRAGKARIATCAESVMAHIARHDPARVLAEVSAKRRIVARISTNPDGFPWHVAVLTEVYDDHPDYRDEWRP